jgi:hypothetical protein
LLFGEVFLFFDLLFFVLFVILLLKRGENSINQASFAVREPKIATPSKWDFCGEVLDVQMLSSGSACFVRDDIGCYLLANGVKSRARIPQVQEKMDETEILTCFAGKTGFWTASSSASVRFCFARPTRVCWASLAGANQKKTIISN